MRILIALLLLISIAVPQAGAQTLNLPGGVPGEASVFGGGETIQLAQQQPRKRRSLLDILFGRDAPEPEAQPQQQQQSAPRRQTQRRATPSPSVVNLIEKNENATRLAVIGDSLAVDLAKALDRLYADDPNLKIVSKGVGSSGFVRDDFFDWNAALAKSIEEDEFDLVVIAIGINDRQEIVTPNGRADPLTDPWKAEYVSRLEEFLNQLRSAGIPAVWVGLPPMRANSYSSAIAQISSLHRTASFSGGAEFVDIYERFVDENGNYSAYGPDLSGQNELMRKSDGIHWSAAGADKVAFYIDKAVKLFYRGGAVSIEVADPLAGSPAQTMSRPPYQGIGQVRLLEVAGIVASLNEPSRSAGDLLEGIPDADEARIDFTTMLTAPVGRVDAFGVGVVPGADDEEAEGPAGQDLAVN